MVTLQVHVTASLELSVAIHNQRDRYIFAFDGGRISLLRERAQLIDHCGQGWSWEIDGPRRKMTTIAVAPGSLHEISRHPLRRTEGNPRGLEMRARVPWSDTPFYLDLRSPIKRWPEQIESWKRGVAESILVAATASGLADPAPESRWSNFAPSEGDEQRRIRQGEEPHDRTGRDPSYDRVFQAHGLPIR